MLTSVEHNLIDGFFVSGQDDPPWTVHSEAVVDVAVDLGALEAAAREVLGANPLLSARLDIGSGRRWVVDDTIPDTVSPLVTVVEPGINPRQLTAMLVSRPFDLANELPVRFYVEMHAVDRRLLVVGHHAVLDGVAVQAVMSAWICACRGAKVPRLDGWREAHAIPFAPCSTEREAAVVDRLRGLARGDVVRLASRGSAIGSGYGVAYNRLPAVSIEGSPAAGAGATRNDLVVAAVAAAAIRWNRRCGQPALPMTIGVPVNLRQPRSWAEGAFNATVPWPVRIEVDDPVAMVRSVVDQLQAVRAGIYSRDLRALLSYLRRRGGMPLWLRRGVAAMTTMVSHVPTVPHSEASAPGAEAVIWGGAPASRWMPMTFCVMSDASSMRLSTRYLSSQYGCSAVEELTSLVLDSLRQVAATGHDR